MILELAIYPLRYTLAVRQYMYLWHILSRKTQTCEQEYASACAFPLCENDGNGIARSVWLVSKNVRKQSPFKIQK